MVTRECYGALFSTEADGGTLLKNTAEAAKVGVNASAVGLVAPKLEDFVVEAVSS